MKVFLTQAQANHFGLVEGQQAPHIGGEVVIAKPIPMMLGTCCACGNSEPEETPCPKREDRTHCNCWWDGEES